MRNFFIFLLCLNLSFSLQAQQYADCDQALEICKKQNYSFAKVNGEGRNTQEADMVSCFMNGDNLGNAEENSAWIRFEIEESGWLTFTITPKDPNDDIDFVVYRLKKDGNCMSKQIIRCMAAGYLSKESPCMGKTGLRQGERKSSRDAGCNDFDDNAWLAPIRAVKGDQYVVLISNVSKPGPGFDISFGGSAKLPCDDEVIEEPKEEPIAEVVNPKKEEPKPEIEEPAIVKTETPSNIGGRSVEIGETVKVKERTITVSIWDGQIVDGDVISIFLNDKKVVDHATLTASPKTYEIELPAGKEHYLTVYADDFGKAEPNTAMVKIFDGQNEQTINLVAGRTKQESVKIVLE